MKKTLVFHNLVPEKGETGKQIWTWCNVKCVIVNFLLVQKHEHQQIEKNYVDEFDLAGKKLRERIEDLLEVKFS